LQNFTIFKPALHPGIATFELQISAKIFEMLKTEFANFV
jgi:hypothetical protein